MKLLVFGQTGQVAMELARRAGPGVTVHCLGRAEADLTDSDACAARIAATEADAIINAAAYTAVDKADAEPALAHRINAEAPGAMARAAAARGLPYVHISTDYVFDGSGTAPRAPDAPTGPLNVYGRTKLAGERAAIEAWPSGTRIVRTQWLYGPRGNHFPGTIVRLGRERGLGSPVAESNRRHQPYHGCALPTELMGRMAGVAGLEPTNDGVKVRCLHRLGYTPFSNPKKIGEPTGIRTPDTRLRRPLLYPAEL